MTSVKPLLAEIWNERRNPDTVPRSDYDAMLAKAWELAEALKKIVNKALDVRTAHNEAYENCAVDDLFEHTMDSLDMNQIILTSFTTAYPEKGEKSEPTS